MSQSYFFIRTDKQYVRVNFNEIICIEGNRSFIRIHTDNDTYLLLLTLRRLDDILPADQFCRIHRSCIVALDRIQAFNIDSVQLQDRVLPIGDKFRRELEKRVKIVVCDVRHKPKLPDVNFKDLIAPRKQRMAV